MVGVLPHIPARDTGGARDKVDVPSTDFLVKAVNQRIALRFADLWHGCELTRKRLGDASTQIGPLLRPL